MNDVIIAEGLWKRYRLDRRANTLTELAYALMGRSESDPGTRWALQDVSIQVEQGKSVGLFGPNGSPTGIRRANG